MPSSWAAHTVRLCLFTTTTPPRCALCATVLAIRRHSFPLLKDKRELHLTLMTLISHHFLPPTRHRRHTPHLKTTKKGVAPSHLLLPISAALPPAPSLTHSANMIGTQYPPTRSPEEKTRPDPEADSMLPCLTYMQSKLSVIGQWNKKNKLIN
ncbi:hypothetical protein E2C01_096452 [Portunus trituberculatus]|uniref:Uncharacterized protein n=1 Tax=Portunus trituberculatus TaxID=210409 RepID=A0A5B7K222_PORTR|nr:hypothetical protein [Portunus trituberculatus]